MPRLKPKHLSEDHKAVLLGLYCKSKEGDITVSQLAPLFSIRPTAIAAHLRKLEYAGLVKLSWAMVERHYDSCERTERCRAYSLTKDGRELARRLLKEAA